MKIINKRSCYPQFQDLVEKANSILQQKLKNGEKLSEEMIGYMDFI